MARRAKTTLRPLHLMGILAAIIAAAAGGWLLLGRHRADAGLGGTDLSLRDYLQNSNALSNNSYKIEGIVRGRLDEDWKSSDGRLFSVEVEEGGETALLPVLIPARFNLSSGASCAAILASLPSPSSLRRHCSCACPPSR